MTGEELFAQAAAEAGLPAQLEDPVAADRVAQLLMKED